MSAPEYHFVTRWSVPGTCAEVQAILDDAAEYVRWYPAVYRQVKVLAARGPDGSGGTIAVETRGWLPYLLHWSSRCISWKAGERSEMVVWGDLEGTGVWTFEQQGDRVLATLDWRVRANKPLIRWLSWLLWPVFAANHRWAVARGEESLRLEIQRRRARTDEECRAVPPPPGPSPCTSGRLAAGLGAVALGLAACAAWLGPRS